MAESERRQRVISSTPRLSPEEVATRSFATGFRGFAEGEVRAFLRRIGDELALHRDRESELLAAVDDLEEQLRAPRPLDEQQLLDALGEETARLLRSAREAADDIRRKSEERAARIVEDAQAEAQRLREEAQELLRTRTSEADAHAAEVLADADTTSTERRDAAARDAEELRARAGEEAEGIVESARQQGREMLDEVRAARERVLADLGRRRALLQGQVEELRVGRDRLLDAYRVVKRTFLDATEALAQVEARAAAGRPVEPVGVPDFDIAAATASGLVDTDAVDVVAPAGTEDAPGPAGTSAEVPGPDAPDVDSLFARLRAGQEGAGPSAAVPGEEAAGAPAEESVEHESTPDTVDLAAAAEPVEEDEPDAAPVSSTDAWRARHAESIEGVLAPLVKRAKRRAQDEQNALLDAVRRHKGRPRAEQVLPAEDSVLAAWEQVVRASLDTAYGAGRHAAGAEFAPAPAELSREVVAAVVAPLRERLAHALDDVDATDTSGLVERIGARYREWKNQQLERALGDAIAAVWTRGVYDAVPEGAVLRWVPGGTEGRCADCDDNALEPTTKGDAFPTGHVHPPAHAGCRCLLAPVEVPAPLATG